MNARAHNTHTQTHTHALVNVKVNGPAIGPDSTALYHHKTETTLRLDDLLGEQMTTAVGFNTSWHDSSQDTKPLLWAWKCLYVCHNPVCDGKAGVSFWLLMEWTPEPDQTAPEVHHILWVIEVLVQVIMFPMSPASQMWLLCSDI